MRRWLFLASLVAVAAAGATIALACGTSYTSAPADAESGADGSALDGQAPASDGGGDGASPFPMDFPAHFPGLLPPAPLMAASDLCAIDTDALTVTSCAMVSSHPPNFVAVPAAGVAALFVASLTVASDVRVTGARALLVVVGGDVTITGSIDVSARLTMPGAGALLTDDAGAGGRADIDGGTDDYGGGGAGYGAAGGAGGVCTDLANGGSIGAPGAPYGGGDAFLGGSHGGASHAFDGGCGIGGGGGGAIQISALGSITIMGRVAANGGGGGPGCFSGTAGFSGAGGGSGGLVFLEARGAVTLRGAVAATGGGGGGGAPAGGNTGGAYGGDGLFDAAPAPGGAAQAGTGGAGGSGGTTKVAAGAGGIGENAGGGGGAVGRIYVLTPALDQAGAIVVPAATSL